MTPLVALERIVYLLDRELAPAAKVRAFQRAAALVTAMDPSELAERATSGRLRELTGIGPTTSEVIGQSLAGTRPDYLARLEAAPVPPWARATTAAGAALRAALAGDCHVHSTWSDGGASIATMARSAAALGHRYLVVTDHSARLTVAQGLDRHRLLAQLEEIAALNVTLAPFRVLTGMEVDILEDGTLDLDEDLLARLDVVVASCHSALRLPRDAMTRRLVAAVANPHVDILGHLTNRKLTGRGRQPSEVDIDVVLAAAARFDTAIEINCRPERLDPPEGVLALVREWGCKVAIDSDAHAPGQLTWVAGGCDRAAIAGIAGSDVVNTLGADALVSWAASHPAP